MRNRLTSLATILSYVGTLLMVFSALILLPILVQPFATAAGREEVSSLVYILPALVCFFAGTALKFTFRKRPLGAAQSMLVCVFGWLAVSAVGALPFWLSRLPGKAALVRGLTVTGDPSRISYLDGYFEAMAGFTTTGITMLSGLDYFPPSLLFWRSLTQWLGGLGILSFFILVLFSAGSAHTLYGAESHKVLSQRPRPGIFNTVKILWLLYLGLTMGLITALVICGGSLFASINLTFTALSTGGFAPFDQSVGYFAARETVFPHYRAIEYVLIVGMLAGGMNFFVHYRLALGRVRALWDTGEMRLWWAVVAGGTALVAFDVIYHLGAGGPAGFEDKFRASLFQSVSVLTTTGFGTKDISAYGYFFGLSKQVFLVLMITGGCVGSTGGGVKVYRVLLLGKMLVGELKKVVRPSRAVPVVKVDGLPVKDDEMHRAAALFFAWIALIVFGGFLTAALNDHGAVESFSGMTSAVSNIGPCYIPATGLMTLHPAVKIVYILGMLAGRLEILPVLMLFNRRAWM
jgi:trk system potassium uptake protein TrkH